LLLLLLLLLTFISKKWTRPGWSSSGALRGEERKNRQKLILGRNPKSIHFALHVHASPRSSDPLRCLSLLFFVLLSTHNDYSFDLLLLLLHFLEDLEVFVSPLFYKENYSNNIVSRLLKLLFLD
jgi:hypothetical protein